MRKVIGFGIIMVVAINSLFNSSSEHHEDRELKVATDPDHVSILVDGIVVKTKVTVPDLDTPRLNGEGEWLCKWSPKDQKECNELFSKKFSRERTKEGESDEDAQPSSDRRGARWLFFGDSTVKRLFDRSDLKKVLLQDPLIEAQNGCLGQEGLDLSCEQREGERCKLNAIFGLPYADKWIAPDPTLFEGPVRFGSENEYCTDCAACQTHFLECQLRKKKEVGATTSSSVRGLYEDQQLATPHQLCQEKQERGMYYGGYISKEFARDTEIQTPEFRTTQENLAAYITRTWNSPEMLQHWRKPICILSAGNHDILINGISTEDIVRNVKFLLMTMKPACEHIIWLGNTSSNRRSTYRQAKERMFHLEKGVKELIASEPELQEMLSFLDVIDASLTFPHKDYIHMYDKWYSLLGEWFINIINMDSAIST